MKPQRAFSVRAMRPRAPLVRASGARRVAMRPDAPLHSPAVAPLSLVFRRARSQVSRPSQRTMAARDGGAVVLAPRLSFILNLFETLAQPLARDSYVQTFVSNGMPGPGSSTFTASPTTLTASNARILWAGRLDTAAWDVTFAHGRIMSRLDHRSAQTGIRALFARLAKPAMSPWRAMVADGSGRAGGQLRAALLPRTGLRDHGLEPFSPVGTSVDPASARRSGWHSFRSQPNAPAAGIRSGIGHRRGLNETLSMTANRHREATESGSRSYRASAEEKFRAVTAVTLTYRTTKAEVGAAMPPQATRPAPPPRPVIDADRLGREIWQQMGRRLRIERERRGKL